jgi:hypothetical protein
MQLFQKGIFDSMHESLYRWRINGPPITDPTPASNEFFGRRVCISGDGTVVAIFSFLTGTGSVSVFKLTQSGISFQLGQTLNGDQLVLGGIQFGAGMALNHDGTRLAVSAPFYNKPNTTGRVTIYDFSDNQWTLIGTFLGSESGTNPAGTPTTNYGLSFNGSGSRFAFQTPYQAEFGVGVVKVFDYIAESWVQVGQLNSFDSISVALLNFTGDTIFAGKKIYLLNASTWDELQAFPTLSETENGFQVTLTPIGAAFNADANTIVISYSINLGNQHRLRTYRRINGTWILSGNQIAYGSVIAQIRYHQLSANANRLISVVNLDNALIYLYIYNVSGDNWTQQSQGFSLPTSSDGGLSGDGKTLAIGTSNKSPFGYTGNTQGVVTVYRKELD